MENLYILIAAFVTAVTLGRMIIPNILIISLRKRLFDVPDERKVHKRPVPRLGGVSFFPVILFALCTPQVSGAGGFGGHVSAFGYLYQ